MQGVVVSFLVLFMVQGRVKLIDLEEDVTLIRREQLRRTGSVSAVTGIEQRIETVERLLIENQAMMREVLSNRSKDPPADTEK